MFAFSSSAKPWYAQRWLQAAVVVLGLIALGVQWGKLVKRPDGDFKLHHELGRRMVAGTYIYENDLDYPYPPFWGFAHAPFSALSPHAAQVVAFPLFVASLLLLIWTLNEMTEKPLPLARDIRFWAVTAAAALASRYLIRDMVECGVNLFLVAMSYLAVLLWSRRREWLAGTSLGLAMALKCTPGLFLVWFAWKRQWKMVAASVAMGAAFTLSPALLMGPKTFAVTFQNWGTRVLAGMGESDPTRGVLGEEPFQNISLKQALARYLTVNPGATNIGRPDHPWYADGLDLPPHVAGWIIKGILASLLLFMAWQFRRPIGDRCDVGILWECSALSLMILLYSPITWGQHCVGMFPAFYLICRHRAARGALTHWETACVSAYTATILFLNRGFLGAELARLLVSYRLHTLGILLVLAVTVARRLRATDAIPDAVQATVPIAPPRSRAA